MEDSHKTLIHADPATHGQRFGTAIVTVDHAAGDCQVIAPSKGSGGSVPRKMRLHSLDEIRGAYQVQVGLAATDPVAKDIADALKFAGQQLKSHLNNETPPFRARKSPPLPIAYPTSNSYIG